MNTVLVVKLSLVLVTGTVVRLVKIVVFVSVKGTISVVDPKVTVFDVTAQIELVNIFH